MTTLVQSGERGGEEQFARLEELVAKMEDGLEDFEEYRRTDSTSTN